MPGRTKRVFGAAIAALAAAMAWHVPPAAAATSITIDDRAVTETDGASSAIVNVRLSEASGSPVTVAYATRKGTATAPADYATKTGTLTFAAGQTLKSISVPIVGDKLDEAQETFNVDLSSPSGAPIGDSTAKVTINDNDPLPTLSTTDVVVREADTGTMSVAFTVNLNPVSGRNVSATWTTVNGSAVAPGDFTAGSGNLTFPAGTTYKTVVVPITSDQTAEPEESFVLRLGAPVGAVLAETSGLGRIVDGDCGLDEHADSFATAALLGTIRGDTGSDALNVTGEVCSSFDEDWFRVHLAEGDAANLLELSLDTNLTPSGTGNLELGVYDASGGLIWSSTRPAGEPEEVFITRNDTPADDSQSVYVRVWSSEGTSPSYDLNLRGNLH